MGVNLTILFGVRGAGYLEQCYVPQPWARPCVPFMHSHKSGWSLEEVWGMGQCMRGLSLNCSEFLQRDAGPPLSPGSRSSLVLS